MEVVEDRATVFQTQRPSIARIFSAKFDVVGLVIDRLREFGDVERTGARAEESSESSVPDVVVLPVGTRKRPSWCRSVANIESRDAVVKTEVDWLRVGVQPLAQR